MKLKIIHIKNGKRFDRLYILTHTDLFDFYHKFLNESLAPIAEEFTHAGSFVTIDYRTETLAASVSVHNIPNDLQEKIRELLSQDDY